MQEENEFLPLVNALTGKNRITVLTGAGISAESGIPTFRGEEGLWKQYRAEELATPQAFAQNPNLVWEWYDWRRQIIGSKEPNPGHKVLAGWEDLFPEFTVITQNIDGFHRKAGSKKVLELHGNIWSLRCTREHTVTEDHSTPLTELPPLCSSCGALLRPHVVWFGESLDPGILNKAFLLSSSSEAMFVIGTSAIVQPAASLPLAAEDSGAVVIEINPDPTPLTGSADFSFHGKAGEILPKINFSLRKALKKKGGD